MSRVGFRDVWPRRRPGGLVRFNPIPLRLSTRSRQKSDRSFTFTRRRNKKQTSGIGVTDHYDARLIYRKRRMRPRMRRRWKQFKNKVLAVSEKGLGSQTVVFNTTISAFNAVAGEQVYATCGLYTANSTVSYYNDMDSIGALNAGAVTTPTTGLSVSASSKVIFKSAVLDLTIRNASTVATAGGPVLTSEARLEVDIYEVILKRADEEGAVYTTLADLFNQNSARTDPIGGAGTELSLITRGVTPFDLTYALSNFGIKILSKRKYQISNGDQITYQVRDPRRHVFPQRELTSTEGFAFRGLTRMVVIVGKLSPGLTKGASTGQYTERLEIGLTRKYFYKVENWSEDRTQFING